MDQVKVKASKSQKRKGQYPAAILNEEALPIMDLLYGQKDNFFLREQSGKSQAGKMSLARFGIKLEQGFASSCPLALAYNNSRYKTKLIFWADPYMCGDILWWLWHQQSNLHTDCIQHEDLDHGFLWQPAKEDKMCIVNKTDSMKNISSFSYSLSVFSC